MYRDVHMGDDENSMHVHICHKKKTSFTYFHDDGHKKSWQFEYMILLIQSDLHLLSHTSI
jgi:hypothetical protein